MPMLIEALVASWRDVERHCAEVEGDERHAWCVDLDRRMAAAYQRLFDVFPRAEVDTALIRALLTEGVELRRAADHRTWCADVSDGAGAARTSTATAMAPRADP